MLRFSNQYYAPALAILMGLAAMGSVLTLIQYLRYRKNHPSRARVHAA